MKHKLLQENPKTYALIFDKEEEFLSTLQDFAAKEQLSASSFTGIGALERLTLGYFDRARKDYKEIPVVEQVEVLSLIGDIAEKDGQAKVHAHVVVGRSDGLAMGGHVLEAIVWPTLEVILTETPAHLRKQHDEETGLALINPRL